MISCEYCRTKYNKEVGTKGELSFFREMPIGETTKIFFCSSNCYLEYKFQRKLLQHLSDEEINSAKAEIILNENRKNFDEITQIYKTENFISFFDLPSSNKKQILQK